MSSERSSNIFMWAGIGFGFLLLLAVITRAFFMTYIDEHHVGVYVQSGNVLEERDSGYQFFWPFTHNIIHMPTGRQTNKVEGISAASSDNFTISETAIEYDYVIHEHSHVYENMPNFEGYIQSAIDRATNRVLGQETMNKIPRRRGNIEDDIVSETQRILGEDFGVEITGASISYFNWDEHARTVLQRRQASEADRQDEEDQAEKDRLRNEREMANAESQAERKRVESQAEADAERERARAEAEAEQLRAEAESERLRKIAEVLKENPNLIEYQRVRQWDGKQPQIMGGDIQSRFMMDLD